MAYELGRNLKITNWTHSHDQNSTWIGEVSLVTFLTKLLGLIIHTIGSLFAATLGENENSLEAEEHIIWLKK